MSDLFYFERDGGPPRESGNATLEEVLGFIQDLDGEARTGVMLWQEERIIAVGGGNHGKVISYFTDDNEAFYTLTDDANSQGVTELSAFGQPVEYDNRITVSKEKTIQAVRDLLTGVKGDLVWELD